MRRATLGRSLRGRGTAARGDAVVGRCHQGKRRRSGLTVFRKFIVWALAILGLMTVALSLVRIPYEVLWISPHGEYLVCFNGMLGRLEGTWDSSDPAKQLFNPPVGWCVLSGAAFEALNGTQEWKVVWPFRSRPELHLQSTLWSVHVPGWALAIPSLLLAACFHMIGRQMRRQGVCPACGYDLTGNLTGICPECGTIIPRRSTNVVPKSRAVPRSTASE